jgi:iron complex outermembrane receptor protein
MQWQTNEEHLNPNNFLMEENEVLARQRVWQRGVGVFLIDRMDLGPDWSVMGSVRLDRINNELTDLMITDSSNKSGRADFSNVTGRLGATFQLTKEIALYGSWGQGFIPPSTHELGTNPDGYGGFNANLVPATSNSVEVGARGTIYRNLDCDVTGFAMSTTNDFDRYRMAGRGNGEQGTFYKNVGATRRYGLEFSAQYKLVEALSIRLAYTYSHFTYDIGAPVPIVMDDATIHKEIDQGNRLPNSPAHQLVVDFTYQITPDVVAGLYGVTLSKAYIDGANVESEAAPGYTLLGGQIGYHWHVGGLSGELSVSARNLGDTRYVAFTEPDPGGNSYQPGSGREFFARFAIQL